MVGAKASHGLKVTGSTSLLEERSDDKRSDKGDIGIVGELLASTTPLIAPAMKDLEWSPRIYDAELDGVRVLAIRDGDVVTLKAWTTTGSGSQDEEEPADSRLEAIQPFYPNALR